MTNTWIELAAGIVLLALAGLVGFMIAKTSESHQAVVYQQKIDSLNTKLEIQENENRTFRVSMDSLIRVSLAAAVAAGNKTTPKWDSVIREVSDTTLKRQIAEIRDDYAKQTTSLMTVIKADSIIIQRQDSVIDAQDLLLRSNNDEQARLQAQVATLNAQKSSALGWKLLSIGEAALVTIVAIKR